MPKSTGVEFREEVSPPQGEGCGEWLCPSREKNDFCRLKIWYFLVHFTQCLWLQIRL